MKLHEISAVAEQKVGDCKRLVEAAEDSATLQLAQEQLVRALDVRSQVRVLAELAAGKSPQEIADVLVELLVGPITRETNPGYEDALELISMINDLQADMDELEKKRLQARSSMARIPKPAGAAAD